MAIGRTNAGGNGSKDSILFITAPEGANVTCVLNNVQKPAVVKDGVFIFRNCGIGDWVITVSQAGHKDYSETLSITNENQQFRYYIHIGFPKIYGIQRNVTSSSPIWTRTDDAVGFNASGSVGTKAGKSDFDKCYPWSEIKRETINNNVMVRIPAFYYQRYMDGNIEHIRIADKPVDGFSLHPLFDRSGKQLTHAYVGAYKTSSKNKSVSGAAPQVNQTRATMRNNACANGGGWGIIDVAAQSAIQMLFLIEFSTYNSQMAIGSGYCNASAALKTGTCDSVPGLTGRPSGTDGKVDVVYRGIEGLWGNVWEWVDGINVNSGTYYICNDQSKYADDTTSGYTALSYKGGTGWEGSFITREGLDTGKNCHIMYPTAAGSGSDSTYMCDAVWSDSGWRVVEFGGGWVDGSGDGLFCVAFDDDSSSAGSGYGSRLLYLPY